MSDLSLAKDKEMVSAQFPDVETTVIVSSQDWAAYSLHRHQYKLWGIF